METGGQLHVRTTSFTPYSSTKHCSSSEVDGFVLQFTYERNVVSFSGNDEDSWDYWAFINSSHTLWTVN